MHCTRKRNSESDMNRIINCVKKIKRRKKIKQNKHIIDIKCVPSDEKCRNDVGVAHVTYRDGTKMKYFYKIYKNKQYFEECEKPVSDFIRYRMDNIIVYQFWKMMNGSYYVFYEYKDESVDLFNALSSDNMTLDIKKIIIYKMLKIISDLRRLNVCHKDISLENFIIDDKLNLYLIDFEVSNFNGEAKYVCGKRETSAPECFYTDLVSEGYDERSTDVYSLGMIIFCILAEQYMYMDFDQKKLMMRFHNDKIYIKQYLQCLRNSYFKKYCDEDTIKCYDFFMPYIIDMICSERVFPEHEIVRFHEEFFSTVKGFDYHIVKIIHSYL